MKLVIVDWLDSRQAEGWLTDKELAKLEIVACRSVGWLAVDEPDRVVVSPHRGTEPDQGCGGMVIPRIAVTGIVELEAPGEGGEPGAAPPRASRRRARREKGLIGLGARLMLAGS